MVQVLSHLQTNNKSHKVHLIRCLNRDRLHHHLKPHLSKVEDTLDRHPMDTLALNLPHLPLLQAQAKALVLIVDQEDLQLLNSVNQSHTRIQEPRHKCLTHPPPLLLQNIVLLFSVTETTLETLLLNWTLSAYRLIKRRLSKIGLQSLTLECLVFLMLILSILFNTR